MTVTAIRKDVSAHTLTMEAEFDASPERLWQLWADPRQLERWWGPPTYPATVTGHDLRAGGRVDYYMTGPTGDTPHGFWNVIQADPPHALVFRDGFANADGSPNTDLPSTESRITIESIGGGRTRMSVQAIYSGPEAMERLLAMGMEQGLKEAIGQIDAILAEDAVRR